MNVAGQTICLNMIVKNEASVIRRCLETVKPFIDSWVVVDTGSTDGTQSIIQDYLNDLPGTLHEQPWQNFADNRSGALRLARGNSDYILIIDADDTLEVISGSVIQALTADSYTIDIQDPPTLYRRTQLVRGSLPWRYDGVLHEYLTCDEAGPAEHLAGVIMHRHHDGARRKDPQTYRRDVEVLKTALATETRPFLRARYTFYLAQSYRDCGEPGKALEHDLARAEMGLWQEEVFISLYRAAQAMEQLGYADQQVVDAYLRASAAQPARAEALHAASRFCRIKQRYEEGYQLARRGLDIAVPSEGLFVEPWIYEFGLLDEMAVNAYWSGHSRESLDANIKILATGKLTGPELQRVITNTQFANQKLPRKSNLGNFSNEEFVSQHALVPRRKLGSHFNGAPRVLLAILAKQKEDFLPFYLQCIEALDYPKSSIVLYIRTNNNTDQTEQILRTWVDRVGSQYGAVEFDNSDVDSQIEQFGVHEWNATRFNILARIRAVSLRAALEHECDFYFVVDVDNFVRPCTLREMVALDLPIVAPMLRSIGPTNLYSNYHADVDVNGYYEETDQYFWILNRWIRGVIEVPVVHCAYLVRTDVIDRLTYEDETRRHEYVIFSDSARKQGIPQYIDNRQIYGYVLFGKGHDLFLADGVLQAAKLLEQDQPEEALVSA